MSHADVYETVSPIVPVRLMEWPDDSAPKLPWAVYFGEDTPICAGNEQIAVKHRWTVELYQKSSDAELEMRLADALRERFGPIHREETRVKSEGMFEVIYTFHQIEGKEDFDG